MKRGIDALNTENTQPAKKAKIEKSLETLLEEVNQGNYTDFREYLANRSMLDLAGKAPNLCLRHLSRALQGTQVVDLNLAHNGIGEDVAKLKLEGTQVTNLDLSHNWICFRHYAYLNLQGTQVAYLNLKSNEMDTIGIITLERAIPDTSLLGVQIGLHAGVKWALEKNHQTLVGKPLSVLWESYSEQKVSNPAKTLAKCREAGVPELQDLILSFLSGMAITTQYKNKQMPMGKLLQQLAKDEIANISATKNKLSR